MTTQEKIRRILDECYSQDLRNKHAANEIYGDIVEPLEKLIELLEQQNAGLQAEILSLNLSNNDTHFKTGKF